jgi:hypothetical protein
LLKGCFLKNKSIKKDRVPPHEKEGLCPCT